MRKLLLYKIEVKLLEDKSTGERNGDRMKERYIFFWKTANILKEKDLEPL